jgi:ketosteroid isomerase-like protein
MKKIFLSLVALFSICFVANAQTKQETAVGNAVEQLRKAMVDADSVMLDKLVSPKLSYGHSGGLIEGKTEFIQKIASGKSDFVTIEITEQTISISKDVAVVRHKLNAATNDNGKPGKVNLGILLIWQKQQGSWKLLARQAVKLP